MLATVLLAAPTFVWPVLAAIPASITGIGLTAQALPAHRHPATRHRTTA